MINRNRVNQIAILSFIIIGQLIPAETQLPEIQKTIIYKTTRLDQLALGPRAESKVGDYVMESDGIKLYFSNPKNKTNKKFSTGGFLIDYTRDTSPLDHFEGLFPVYNYEGKEPYSITDVVIENVKSSVGTRQILKTTGRDKILKDLQIVTEYDLDSHSHVLTIKTTITNNEPEPVPYIALGDNILWGFMNMYAKGSGYIVTGQSESPWLCGVKDDQSIGYFNKTENINAQHNDSVTLTDLKQLDKLAPKESVSIIRYLRLANQNIAITHNEVYREFVKLGGLGRYNGKVIDKSTGEGVANVLLSFSYSSDLTNPAFLPLLNVVTDSEGFYNVLAPAGYYYLRLFPPGRLPVQINAVTEVKANDTTFREINVPSQNSKLQFRVTDSGSKKSLPCKIVIDGIEGTRNPVLGSTWDFPSTQNIHYTTKGFGTINLAPGKYKVNVVRGTEYKPWSQVIDLKPGKTVSVNAAISRYIDTTGYISVDVGTRTNNSFDCLLSPKQVVEMAACEGLEMLVSGDINQVTNLQTEIDKAGLNFFIKASNGLRIMPDGENGYGNYMLFPVDDPAIDGNLIAEAIAAFGEDSFSAFELIRETFPNSIFAVTEVYGPRSYFEHSGYPELLQFPPSADQISYDFDMYELYSDKHMRLYQRGHKLRRDLRARQIDKPNYGHSQGSAAYYKELGYPRTFVKSSTDEPGKINPDEIFENLKAGRLIISNGPFIRATVNGKGMAEIISVSNENRYRVSLKVQSPEYAGLVQITVLANGTMLKAFMPSPSNSQLKFPVPGRDPSEFTFRVFEDTIITFVAWGHNGANTLMTPEYNHETMSSANLLGISGPFYIDHNGDGECFPPPPIAPLSSRFEHIQELLEMVESEQAIEEK